MPRRFAALALALTLSMVPASHGLAQESMAGESDMAAPTDQMDSMDPAMTMEQMPADDMATMDDSMAPMNPMMP